MQKIVVIGGLAAGPAAAARAVRTNPRARVTLIEAGPHVAYGVCELPFLVSGQIVEPQQLTPYSAERLARDKGIAEVLVEHRAVHLDTQAQQISVQDRRGHTRELDYDSLILATGSTPRCPATGGARPLKTIADAIAIRDQAATAIGGSAAVLGAGYIGLEAADSLRLRGLYVIVVDREPLPLRGFEEEARRLVLAAMVERGVQFIGRTEAHNGMVAGVDFVVAALGIVAEVALARAAKIELGRSGAIQVDERCETSTRGVYAAGDCAEVVHLVTGRREPVALATVANRMGRVAGSNAAGGNQRFKGSVRALAFSAFGLEIARAGAAFDEAVAAGFAPRLTTIISSSKARAMPGAEPLLVTLVVDGSTGRLLGANTIGATGAALRLSVLAPLIERGATVAELAQLELPYAPTFSPLSDPVITAARVALRTHG